MSRFQNKHSKHSFETLLYLYVCLSKLQSVLVKAGRGKRRGTGELNEMQLYMWSRGDYDGARCVWTFPTRPSLCKSPSLPFNSSSLPFPSLSSPLLSSPL